MVVNKRRKNSRQRGSHTHGWGAKKKHRGAGHRGGRGKAGSGKKGDAKKTKYWKEDYFGKKGFTSLKKTVPRKTINLALVEAKLQSWAEKGYAKQEKEFVSVNLTKAGYTKLLGAGTLKTKMSITVKEASASAIKKVEGLKGKVAVHEEKKGAPPAKEE
jgi:large subunit ribosomal protein L15